MALYKNLFIIKNYENYEKNLYIILKMSSPLVITIYNIFTSIKTSYNKFGNLNNIKLQLD